MNNRIRRFALLAILLLFSSIILIAEETDSEEDYMTIEVSLKSGFMNGEIREYVFNPVTVLQNGESKFISDFKMSELDWDIKNLPVLNFATDFDILKYIYTGFTASIGIPGYSGNMQDYDWLNPFYSDWMYDDPTEITNYSCHTNKLEKYINFTYMLGGNIWLPLSIKLSLFAAYEYDYIGFTGYDGYTIYKSDDFEQIDMEEGKVISYRVDTNSFLFGLKAVVASVPRTLISAGVLVSPGMTAIGAFDYHYRNGDRYAQYGNAYWDMCKGHWQVQADLSVLYKFNQHHRLGLYGNIYYVPTTKSTTSQKRLNKYGLPENGAWSTYTDGSYGGVDRFTWTVSLNYSFLL